MNTEKIDEKIAKLQSKIDNPNVHESVKPTLRDALQKLQSQKTEVESKANNTKHIAELKKKLHRLESKMPQHQKTLDAAKASQDGAKQVIAEQAMQGMEKRIEEIKTELAELGSPIPKIEVKDDPEKGRLVKTKKPTSTKSGGKITQAKTESVCEDFLPDLKLPHAEMPKIEAQYVEALGTKVCEKHDCFTKKGDIPNKVETWVKNWLKSENTKAKKQKKEAEKQANTCDLTDDDVAEYQRLLAEQKERQKQIEERRKARQQSANKPKPRPTTQMRQKSVAAITKPLKTTLKNQIKEGKIENFDSFKNRFLDAAGDVRNGLKKIAKLMGANVSGYHAEFNKEIRVFLDEMEAKYQKQMKNAQKDKK